MHSQTLAIFGGTFDPIHNGHLLIAQYVRDTLQLDKVIFIPANIPPHKGHQNITDTSLRLQMLNLAINSNPAFESSSIELDKQGISYSVETLRAICSEWQIERTRLFFIIGADSLKDIQSWYRPDEIFALSQIVVVPRSGANFEELKQQYHSRAIFVDAPLIDISSSRIRQWNARNISIRYMVPPEVEHFIRSHGLYQD
ncbi:nicotinate-nucleotide adenylyltransferase [candidate division KSB1 bacterium]|nr:nicotinate-nucleotide adenylyltransferase [candidate division KSB1 bacterium]